LKTFTLLDLEPQETESPEEDDASESSDANAAKEGESVSEAPPVISAPSMQMVRVELRGVVDSGRGKPTFAVIVHAPDGQAVSRRMNLGQTIYGPWKAQEFNPQTKTLTVSDGQRLLLFQPGEQLDLEFTEESMRQPEGEAPKEAAKTP
jgi:hypothetical protein